MAQLIDIKRVSVGPRALTAVVEIAPDGPLMTSDDPEGTERVLALMPGLADHACLGDASPRFAEVVADTEIAHLLEHATVELLAQTDVAGDIASGQTREVADRTYEIMLSCPDDVLVAAALSSAAWVLEWAYSGGGEPQPDVAAIVDGVVALVQSLDAPARPQEPAPDPAAERVADPESAEEPPAAPAEQEPAQQELPFEPVPGPDAEPAPEPDEPQAPSDPAPQSDWGRDDIPRPHLVR